MPPIPPGNLIPGNMYVVVTALGGQHIQQFVDIMADGFVTFGGRNVEIGYDPADTYFFNVGDPDIAAVVAGPRVAAARAAAAPGIAAAQAILAGRAAPRAAALAALIAALDDPAPAPAAAAAAAPAAAAAVVPGIPILDNAIDIGIINVDPESNNAINRIQTGVLPSGTDVYVISGPGFRHIYNQADIRGFFQARVSGNQAAILINPGNGVAIGNRHALNPGFRIERGRLYHTDDYGNAMAGMFAVGGRRKRAKRSKSKRSTKAKRSTNGKPSRKNRNRK